MQVILSDLMNTNMKFKSHANSADMLKNYISDANSMQLISVKNFIIDVVLEDLRVKSTDSVNNYFERLIQ